MKKILLITDNIIVYQKIKKTIQLKNREDVEFSYRYSSSSAEFHLHPDFINSINSQIDLKKETSFILSNFDLVISAHCFQLFPVELVNNIRCINIHPGYNPINRGWFPQVFAIAYNLPIGATIHEIDNELDHGNIIARKYVEKNIWDTSLSVYNRVLNAEIELFSEYFDQIVDGTYSKFKPENEGNIFYKKDFEELREIDMEETGKFIDFYNKMRALSHGNYKNAYFIDMGTGKKIYIKIEVFNE